jgi:hypothetical protein
MRALTVLHRWFGVAFCLLFAMWFATGAVMHWMPFPELTEDERIEGLSLFEPGAVKLAPARALEILPRNQVARLRLSAPGAHLTYVATLDDGSLVALDAAGGAPLAVDAAFALASATAHAKTRGLDLHAPVLVATAGHDQWTVSNGLDAHRPLYRVALNDAAGTELYVSSVTGEVVRDTARRERLLNFAGSVLHWIYPTVLRQHWAAWDRTVWWLSLAALLGALAGTLLGILRLRNFASPFRGWHYWHHVLGLACAAFVLTWIASGWLSMDHGRIFSDGHATAADIEKIHGAALTAADLGEEAPVAATLREVEWSRLGGRLYRRQITVDAPPVVAPAAFVEIAARLGAGCSSATIAFDDAYAARSRLKSAPVWRLVCADIWWHIDSADGRVIEKLDPSRRVYRWAFRALHTLDFPFLPEKPPLRSALVMLLCTGGFAFSVTGVIIGWRRLKSTAAGV